jgi:hypothetical protein
MSTDLHFVCPHRKNWTKIDESTFETGRWSVSEATAREAVGGRIYLHETQSAPAWHGGTIRAWRALPTGRVFFTYAVDGPFRTVCKDGWGQEKATIRR